MMRDGSRVGIGLVVLVVGLTTSGASAEDVPKNEFFVACAAAERVDQAVAATVCAEFMAAFQDQPGLSVHSSQPAPLSVGPGLEIMVERATDTGLEVTPTWVDAQGTRATQPTVGVRISDARMTQALRRDFFLRLLAEYSK